MTSITKYTSTLSINGEVVEREEWESLHDALGGGSEPLVPDEYIDAQRLASEIEQRLVDGGSIDEERGSLAEDGFHALRLGTSVVASTWDGRWALDFDSIKDAQVALAKVGPAA